MTLAALFVSPCLARLAARYRSAIAKREFWRSAFFVPSRLLHSKDGAKEASRRASYHPDHAAGAPVDFRKEGRICVRRQDIAP
jgi:hypothetical protein